MGLFCFAVSWRIIIGSMEPKSAVNLEPTPTPVTTEAVVVVPPSTVSSATESIPIPPPPTIPEVAPLVQPAPVPEAVPIPLAQSAQLQAPIYDFTPYLSGESVPGGMEELSRFAAAANQQSATDTESSTDHQGGT